MITEAYCAASAATPIKPTRSGEEPRGSGTPGRHRPGTAAVLRAAVAGATALVLPSRDEGLGLPLAETMGASELPGR
ncbi:MAG: glycosyltransferase family 1 protein, partial [Actinomycetota bacterium]|nr:glycosyltransferase family 1 protein [Actinomycetota bacterium]